MTDRFEKAFIQCLREGIYPGPSNINERFRADGLRINRLNGQYSKMRTALMYEFGVPYQRGVYTYDTTLDGYHYERRYQKSAGDIPDYPYLTADVCGIDFPEKPVMGSRKHEIQDENKPWELRRK